MPNRYEARQPLNAETIVKTYGWSRCNPAESFVGQSTTYPLDSSRVVARLQERDEAGDQVNLSIILEAGEPTNPDFNESISLVETIADRISELGVVEPADPHWEMLSDIMIQ